MRAFLNKITGEPIETANLVNACDDKCVLEYNNGGLDRKMT